MKPNVNDFDLQPYGYIHALQAYIDRVENKCLDRLRQQYLETKKEESTMIKTLRVSNYTGMRNLCLDCELVSFNDIELMESEVNSSFS